MRFYNQCLRAAHLQLTLTLIAFPVFIHWGLPLSLATYIATLFFSPFLTAFLFFSTILFFTELLNIPNTLLCIPLELLSSLWLSILSYSNASWLIGFARPPIYILLCMPIITLFVITHKKTATLQKNVIALVILSLVFVSLLKIYPHLRSLHVDTIACGKRQLPIIINGKTTIIIDQSCLSRKVSTHNWITYTLSSNLFQKSGSLDIGCFIAQTISNRLLCAIEEIAQKCRVQTVYIPFRPSVTTTDNPLFTRCAQILAKENTKLICVEKDIDSVVNLNTQVQLRLIKKGSSTQIRTHIVTDTHQISF